VTTRNVIIHRQAGRELRVAARRYGAASPLMEQRFRAAVGRAFSRIATAAEQCSPCGHRYRWVKAGRFPYIVYFQILSDAEAIVYAVGHERRRPGYWRGRASRP
jgi:ParE-like toxin of type II ParDE toxin-antitoxin system